MPVTADVGATLAAITAIAAGIVGLSQYVRSERWKRAEFAVRLVRQLATDLTFSFCCRAIDWGVGPLIIPECYRVLFPNGSTLVEHDWSLMAKALRPGLHPDWKENKAQFLLYRFAFDDFFAYLDCLAMSEHLNVIKMKDLSPLTDYLRQLRQPLYWTNQDDEITKEIMDTQVFGDFIKTYYSGLWKLIEIQGLRGNEWVIFGVKA